MKLEFGGPAASPWEPPGDSPRERIKRVSTWLGFFAWFFWDFLRVFGKKPSKIARIERVSEFGGNFWPRGSPGGQPQARPILPWGRPWAGRGAAHPSATTHVTRRGLEFPIPSF